MAKLRTHGTELLRISHERDIAPKAEVNEYSENGFMPTNVYWEKVTRAYFSDGKVLEKRQVKFTPWSINTNDDVTVQDWGWKLAAKAKDGVDIHARARKTLGWVKANPEKGWKVEGSNEFALYHATRMECTICRQEMSAEEYYSQHIDSHPCE